MDTALKQRLVGASVLIALAVIVLPMILGGRPDGEVQQTQKIELPPQPPELDFETRRYPIGEQPVARSTEEEPAPAKALPSPAPVAEPVIETAQDSPPDESASEQAAAEPSTDEQRVVEPVSEDPSATVDVKPLPAPVAVTESPGRYVVQVASFGALANANRLAGTLRDFDYTVMLDSIKSDVGTLHRVRVGPYDDEASANAAASRLQAQVSDVKPRVMDLQPEKTAQVTQPSDPLVRWVVQVGVFSDSSNAENLVARLRLESLSAYSEQISRSGSEVYRVRVGPFLERDDAIRAGKLISDRLSIEGVVMSAD